jgi:signal transduction histidine kinase
MAMLLLLAGGLTAYTTWLLSRDVIAQRDAAETARRDLVAAVSHDLRTPLTSLRLLSEAIEDDLVDSETRARYVEQLSVHIRSLSSLIEDLFELSRLEAGDIQWSLARVHIDELVEETVEAMRAQADARRVEVRAAVPGDLAPAQANPERLQRVLFNLIQNAIRHTPADGSVTVLAESNGRTVEVEVADTGSGLPADERERAFEPFYRGGSGAARSGDGTGLGLTICRAIIEAHGGEIWFADAERGARVRFSLPRAAPSGR